MIIQPKIRGFICTAAHPVGCAAHVAEQIAYTKAQGALTGAPKRVLVVGSSTGYGLASRIAAAFGGGAATVGVAFEKTPEPDRTATAGWYNTAAFEKEAKKAGLYARSFNGDAFGDAMKEEVFAAIKKDLGTIDGFVYSLASPRRTHPKTGEQFRSVLKPLQSDYTAKTVDTDKKLVHEVTLTPASPEEVRHTVAVMGGEDWQMWMEGLRAHGLLAPGFVTTAYSYIGPEMTWPIYRDGTIGQAKKDLERAATEITNSLKSLGGQAYVTVCKGVVTQASSAIPVVPLYLSIMQRVMKEAGTHEGTIEQIVRLWQQLSAKKPNLDTAGRIRIDNLEMEPKIQAEILRRWALIGTENLNELSDFAGYQAEFLKLFGFGLKGVDYAQETDPMVAIPSLPAASAAT